MEKYKTGISFLMIWPEKVYVLVKRGFRWEKQRRFASLVIKMWNMSIFHKLWDLSSHKINHKPNEVEFTVGCDIVNGFFSADDGIKWISKTIFVKFLLEDKQTHCKEISKYEMESIEYFRFRRLKNIVWNLPRSWMDNFFCFV